MNTKQKFLLYGGLVVLMLALVIFAAKSDRTPAEDRAPENALTDITSKDHVKGNPSAAITLIEYADFQCPACRAYAPIVEELPKIYKQHVRIVFRHFPLTSIHRNAFPAAQAAEAAGNQGKFWDMHDLLFEKQSEWSSAPNAAELFRSYAVSLGLDAQRFSADYESNSVIARVQADLNDANTLRLGGTPSFLLNGDQIDSPNGLAAFRVLLDPLVGELSASTVNDTYLETQLDREVYFDLAIYLDNRLQPLKLSEDTSHRYSTLADTAASVVKNTKSGATLGYAIENLGYHLEDGCLVRDEVSYCSREGKTLKVFVNGVRNLDLENYEPEPGDRILISHGPLTDPDLTKQLAAVTRNSCQFNNSCE